MAFHQPAPHSHCRKKYSPKLNILIISCAIFVALIRVAHYLSTVPMLSSVDLLTQDLPKRVAKCSFLERQLILKTLTTPDHVSLHTSCPTSDAWLEEYLERQADSKKFIFLNIGCNKGYDSIRVSRVITRNSAVFNKEKWKIGLEIEGAGVCKQGDGDDKRVDGPLRQAEIHCVEAMPSNYKALKRAAEVTSADIHGLNIHLYALTGDPTLRSIAFPDSAPGTEYLGITACLGTENRAHSCVDVPATTMDNFVVEHVGIKLKDDPGIEDRLPYISIDVEGYDYTVMKAGQRTLKQTDYLEFEHHSTGDWGHQNLSDCIEMLNSLGLHCYWAGVNKLWKITSCWVDSYEAHRWSNIACVNPLAQPQLFQTMEAIFEKTMETTLQEIFVKVDLAVVP
jgi:FkbM family methyltransferase